MEARTRVTTRPDDPGAEAGVLSTVVDGPPIERRIPLTGWFERQGFHPVLAAFLMFVLSFLLFQGLASVIAIIVVLSRQPELDPAGVIEALESATGALLVGNTIGQFVGLAIPVLIWTSLHTNRSWDFLRFGKPDWPLLGFSVLALVAMLPVIQWLGEVNSTLPMPEALRELEEAQFELIERILDSDISLGATIFALAVTPAVCEELLFRGYLQRQLERAFGIAGGVVVTGILFGLYHFRLSQALPLAVLGIFLGWLVWRTGSLWIPILIHFLNNGFAIAAASVAASNPEWGIEDLEHIPVPAPVILAGIVVTAGTVILMNRRVAVLQASQAGNHYE